MKLYVLDIQSVEGISDSNNAVTYEILKANAKALFEIIKTIEWYIITGLQYSTAKKHRSL